MVTFFFFIWWEGPCPRPGGRPFMGSVATGSVQREWRGKPQVGLCLWEPSPPLWRPWLPRTPPSLASSLFFQRLLRASPEAALTRKVRASGPGLALILAEPEVGGAGAKGKVRAACREGGRGPSRATGSPGAGGGSAGEVVGVKHWGHVFWVETLTGDISIPTVQSWDLVKQYFFSWTDFVFAFFLF